MIDRDEATRSLTGAFEVFLDRPDALRHFNLSVAGFWNSFGAIILVLPLYALSAISERAVTLSDPVAAARFDEGLFVLDKVLTVAIDWVALPIVLAFIAARIGVARTYPAFVIVRNWGSVLSILPFGAIGLLFFLEFIDADTADILSLAALFIVLRYNYLIARRGLDVPPLFAAGVVVGDFVLSLSIAGLVNIAVGV